MGLLQCHRRFRSLGDMSSVFTLGEESGVEVDGSAGPLCGTHDCYVSLVF